MGTGSRVEQYIDEEGNLRFKMANTPRRNIPNNQKPGFNDILQKMKERAEEAGREKQEESLPEEDLNILPMPLKQEVCHNDFGTYIQWTWEPVGMGIRIFGILYSTDYFDEGDPTETNKSKGTYEVQVSLPDQKIGIYTYDAVIAKAIGQAMISASRWKDIWKEHAGHFMELELFGYGTEPDNA